jgi:DNA-binding NarL/FixJ family response regulator
MHCVIRVAILDDHPAVLAGVHRLLDGSDDIERVAATPTPRTCLAQ